MKKILQILQIIFFLINEIENAGQKDSSPEKNNCTLTKKISEDPFPSLGKCYKYNNEACCMSVHDDYIKTYVEQILSPSCIRKYINFENLMCFGCHPYESRYINDASKKIRICKSFALALWNNSESEDIKVLDHPTTVFDNCGFKASAITLEEYDSAKDKYVIPSREYDNFTHFLKKIKIPFYEDFEIEIQDEVDDYCYNNSSYLHANFYFLFFFNLLIFILF